VAVAGELDAVCQPGSKIVHEDDRGVAVSAADEPGRDQLGIGINGRPGPHVASTFRGALGGRGRPISASTRFLNFSVADFESGQFGTDSNKPSLARSYIGLGSHLARPVLSPGVSPLAPGFFRAPFDLWAALSRLPLFVRLRWRFEDGAPIADHAPLLANMFGFHDPVNRSKIFVLRKRDAEEMERELRTGACPD
jgi:hypothetical protein